MRDLMRHDGGDLGAVIGEREQAAGHEDVARGQREGVDDGRVEQSDAIGLRRRLARRREPRQNAVEIALGRRRAVLAPESLDQPLAFRVRRRR